MFGAARRAGSDECRGNGIYVKIFGGVSVGLTTENFDQ